MIICCDNFDRFSTPNFIDDFQGLEKIKTDYP
jgi:hypothetical protein